MWMFVHSPWVKTAQSSMFADAEAYERFMGRWSRLAARGLVHFTGLPDTGRVLDAGSGTGSMTFAIAAHRTRVRILGIDPSPEYVAYAINKNAFAGRASFQVGDARELPFPDATFDAAVSLIAFNFIPDPKRALLELRRVTKTAGKLSAAVWDYGAGMQMLRIFWDAATHIDPEVHRVDEKHMPLCRASELSNLWRQNGLKSVREQPIDIEMKFESFADYWNPFLLGQGPAGSYVRRLDRNKLEVLRNEVKHRLSLSEENKSFVLSARVWAVCGTT